MAKKIPKYVKIITTTDRIQDGDNILVKTIVADSSNKYSIGSKIGMSGYEKPVILTQENTGINNLSIIRDDNLKTFLHNEDGLMFPVHDNVIIDYLCNCNTISNKKLSETIKWFWVNSGGLTLVPEDSVWYKQAHEADIKEAQEKKNTTFIKQSDIAPGYVYQSKSTTDWYVCDVDSYTFNINLIRGRSSADISMLRYDSSIKGSINITKHKEKKPFVVFVRLNDTNKNIEGVYYSKHGLLKSYVSKTKESSKGHSFLKTKYRLEDLSNYCNFNHYAHVLGIENIINYFKSKGIAVTYREE